MSKLPLQALRLFFVFGVCAFASATLNAGSVHAASGVQLLYLTDTNLYTIHVYRASEVHHNPSPIQTIGRGDDKPLGLCVDRNGTIFVVNKGFTFERFSYVAVYPAGAGAPSTIIKDGLNAPFACALDKAGTLFVSNDEIAQNGKPRVVIQEYARGSVSPTGQLTIDDPNPTETASICSGGMTFDSAGNLLVSADFYTQSDRLRRGHIFRFAPGTRNAVDLGLRGIGATCESGLGVDRSGNLFVGSFSAVSRNIAVFGPGQTMPSRRITRGLTSPLLFSVDSAGRLYVPNYASPQQPQFANVVEYAPGGSVPVNTITGKDFVSPFGTALTPSL